MVLLKEQYGKQVVVNLLGSRGGEEVLNRAFKVNAVLLLGARGGGVVGEGGEGPAQRQASVLDWTAVLSPCLGRLLFFPPAL